MLDLTKLRSDLERDEGVRANRYQDTEGNWSVGIGHLMTAEDLVHYPDPLSQAQIDSLFTDDLGKTILWLNRNLPWWQQIPEPGSRAIANMAYNIRGRLLGFTKMLAALEAGDYETAASECLNSIWAGQVKDRSLRIAALYRSCIIPAVS